MASFSRSGETLLQRCLNAHPDIEVVHQIREPDSPDDLKLFRHLIRRKEMTIPGNHPLLAHRTLSPNAVILVKNAVWTHAHPRQGFTLARNPFSIIVSARLAYSSGLPSRFGNGTCAPSASFTFCGAAASNGVLKIPGRIVRHAEESKTSEHQRKQQMRWCAEIDPLMMPYVQTAENLDGYLSLYSRKLLQDFRDGLPFVRYEDFVSDPETWLRRIVAHLGIDWSDRVLKSHEDYQQGETGHGKIKLWRPIHEGSTDKYKVLSEAQRARVYALTHEVLSNYGYGWDGEDLALREVPGIIGG